jgi:hypothetical protein
MNPSLEAQARTFWQWFSSVAPKLAVNLENDEILRELDTKAASLGGLSWEVGPGLVKPNALVLSPGGSMKLLDLTREIVGIAPELPDWEYHYAKPPKKWRLQYVVHDAEDKPVPIDASEWEYVLLKLPDGTFDVVVRAPNLQDMHEDVRQMAAEVAVEGMVGELSRLRHIAGIEVVIEWKEKYRGKATPLRHLGDHLQSLTREE